MIDEGAGNGDALALAAGEFVGGVRHAVAQFDGAYTGISFARNFAGDCKFNVDGYIW